MEDEILFEEKQKFGQPWLWVLLLGLNLFFLYKSIINENKEVLVIGSQIILAIITLVFYFANLNTKVTNNGIYLSFFPFTFKTKYYSWESIQKCYVRTYSPLLEYGGWGLRYSFKNGKLYSTFGNFGLQLILKNGNKVLIGTQKPEELQLIVKKAFKN